MGPINWIFDVYQHTKIDEVRKEAMEARLERALGELALATKTVHRLLIDKGVCTHDELRSTLQRVDGEDGRVDGRSPVG